MCLGLQWNEHSKTFWTFTFYLLGRNIAPVHFKTERVAETALRASWFWQNSARFPRTWAIFSSPEESKLTPDGLGLQSNEHSNTFWRLIFELLGWNIAPLHFKTERVGESALRASWFWATSARFSRILAIFSSPGDSKLTPDGLGLQWSGSRKTFWTLSFELLGRNTTVLHFKTEIVAETALRASWFWPSSARFPGTWGIFSSPVDFKLSADGLGLQWNGHSTFFWTRTFELLGRNIALLHFKTERVAETTLGTSWFWPSSAQFPGPWGIFSYLGDAKLTPDGLGLQWNEHSKTFWTLTFGLLARNIAPLYFKTERVAETTLRKSWFWPTSARFPGSWGYFPVPGTLN